MEKIKFLYRGRFNFAREVHTLRTRAYSERQAWLHFCRKLAKIHEVHVIHVMGLFDGSKDNYKIVKEMDKYEE